MDTDDLVLQHQGIRSYNAGRASMYFQLFMGYTVFLRNTFTQLSRNNF